MNTRTDPKKTYIAIASRRFATDGFHGTSLAALAKDANVSKQALLHFFGTKEKIYAEVLRTLADRLCQDIADAYQPEPLDHLASYLASFARTAVTNPADAKLVVRALLDSDPKAKIWPMKPFLDQVGSLVIAASGNAFSEREARAWFFPVIGTVQYMAISTTAIKGMYGKEAAAGLSPDIQRFISRSISGLTGM